MELIGKESEEIMKRRKYLIVIVIVTLGMLMSIPGRASAMIMINEILADPASGLAGDANGDGVRSSGGDEFIELLNVSDSVVDISGWYLTDAVSTRHVFTSGTLMQPNAYQVVFGADALSGSLGLNNSGDTVSLFDALDQLIDQVIYGINGGQNQSLVRTPEGSGSEFVLHTSLTEAKSALFSPGTSVSGGPLGSNSGTTTIPEFPTWIYLSIGVACLKLRNHLSIGLGQC